MRICDRNNNLAQTLFQGNRQNVTEANMVRRVTIRHSRAVCVEVNQVCLKGYKKKIQNTNICAVIIVFSLQ